MVPIANSSDLDELPKQSTYLKEEYLKGKNDSPYGYVVRKPETFGKDSLEYPILVYLHGSGSRGNSAVRPEDLNKVDKDGPIRSIKMNLWNPLVSVPVFAPQSESEWNPSKVKAFINYLLESYSGAINPNRIYISGFSMGAAGTWTYLDKYGYGDSLVAAAVTMAGAKEDAGNNIEQLKLLPFWVFHGQKDKTVPVSRSTNLVSKFRSKYPSQEHQRLTIFPQNDFDGQFHRIDHGIYDNTYWNKNQTGDVFDINIMNWMLQYKRND